VKKAAKNVEVSLRAISLLYRCALLEILSALAWLAAIRFVIYKARIAGNYSRIIADEARFTESYSRIAARHSRKVKNHSRIAAGYSRILENYSRIVIDYAPLAIDYTRIRGDEAPDTESGFVRSDSGIIFSNYNHENANNYRVFIDLYKKYWKY